MPPSATFRRDNDACAMAKLHGVANGAVSSRSYAALVRTTARNVVGEKRMSHPL